MEDDDIISFGAHKGKRLIDVPASYLLWLYDNDKCFGELRDYIIENLKVLRKEVKIK